MGHCLGFIHNFSIALFLQLFYTLWMVLQLQNVVEDFAVEEKENDVWTGMVTTGVEIMAVIAINYAQALTCFCLVCSKHA